METPPKTQEPHVARWTLLRDLGVLQVKLIVDGVRDLLLVPLSLIAGIFSLANGENGQPGPYFYRLLAWGKRSEVWINLFGALQNSPNAADRAQDFGDPDIDDIVGRLESLVVEEVRRGGVTAQAKDRLDRILDALQRKNRRNQAPP